MGKSDRTYKPDRCSLPVSRPRAIFHSNILLPVLQSQSVPYSLLLVFSPTVILYSRHSSIHATIRAVFLSTIKVTIQCKLPQAIFYSISIYPLSCLIQCSSRLDLTQFQYCLPIDLSHTSTAYHSSPQGAFINHVFTASRLFIALEQL